MAAAALALGLALTLLACDELTPLCRAHADCPCGRCEDGTCVDNPEELNSCGLCGGEELCLQPDGGVGVDTGFPVGRWSHIEAEPRPRARNSHACAYDGERTIYMFGGVSDEAGTQRFNDLWAMDTQTWSWAPVWEQQVDSPEPIPNPRFAGAMFAQDDTLFVLGGTYAMSGYDVFEIWAYDLLTNTWEAIVHSSAPHQARASAYFGAAYDSDTQRVWIYAGDATTMDVSLESFFWTFHLGSRQLEQQPTLDTSDTHYMVEGLAMTLLRHEAVPRLLAYGGVEGKSFMDACDARDETWDYAIDSGLWSLVNIPLSERPPDLTDHSLTAVRGGRALLFGGRAEHCRGDPTDGLWRFTLDTGAWEPLAPAGGDRPPVRWGHCAVAIHGGASLFVFGGQGLSRELNDAWVFVDP